MKMYFRNKGAIAFTLIFPLALLSVFGFLSRGSTASMKIDITDYSHTELSKKFVDSLKKVSAFDVKEVTESEAADQLGKGKIDLQVIIPNDLGKTDSRTGNPVTLTAYYNKARPQNGQVASLIISQIAQAFNDQLVPAPKAVAVASSGVQTNNLTYFDFILPGILAMTIMQVGIFGVAFAFVSLKASGALRRLHATPVHPRNFVFAQAITRLVISLLTVTILVGLGIALFHFHMLGNYLSFALIATLGIIVFLGLGFAIAGWAKDENQVPPLANVFQLPMLLLSGIFFPRDSFPQWLKTVTNYFPLTYAVDGMRQIANEGATLAHVWGDILGLVIWVIIVFVIAINVFQWE